MYCIVCYLVCSNSQWQCCCSDRSLPGNVNSGLCIVSVELTVAETLLGASFVAEIGDPKETDDPKENPLMRKTITEISKRQQQTS